MSAIIAIMLLAGLGMVQRNLFSGKVSVRYSPLRIAAVTNGVIVVTSLLLFLLGENKAAALTPRLFAARPCLPCRHRCKFCCCKMRGAARCWARRAARSPLSGSAIGALFGGWMITAGPGWRFVALPAALLVSCAQFAADLCLPSAASGLIKPLAAIPCHGSPRVSINRLAQAKAADCSKSSRARVYQPCCSDGGKVVNGQRGEG